MRCNFNIIFNHVVGPICGKNLHSQPLYHSTRLVETHLMIELEFYIYVFSMELQSFEKPYVALLNSSNWATGGPLWEGCRNFGILLLKIVRVPFSRHNLRTHQYDTKYLNHIEKADSLNFPTMVWGSRTELLSRNITPRKRFRLLFFRFKVPVVIRFTKLLSKSLYTGLYVGLYAQHSATIKKNTPKPWPMRWKSHQTKACLPSHH